MTAYLFSLKNKESRNLDTNKQEDSNSEVIICFVINLSYQQILQLLKVIKVLEFTLCHCH